MKLKSLALAAALVCAGAAQADTFNIGELPIAPNFYSNTNSVDAGAFSDIYNFIFPALGATASGSVVTINIGSILNIPNVQVSLFTDTNTLIASGPTGASSVLFNVPLTAGNSYYYQVTGNATGSAGGAYSFLASAAPIPEPGTYAMLLAGLGVVGLIAARRRQPG
jgi:hypothetical protein